MKRLALALALAGCASPRNLPAPPPPDAAELDSGPDSQVAAPEVRTVNPSWGLFGERDGDSQGDHPVSPEPQDSAPAGDGPVAGTIYHDAAAPPDVAVDLAVAVDKAPKPDKPPPEPPPMPPPERKCVDCGNDCWPALICVVADGVDQLGRVPLGPFCMLAKGGTTVTGTATWEIAGPDGTCTGFFTRFHNTACMLGHPGRSYETRERKYDLRGEFVSESGGTVVLACP